MMRSYEDEELLNYSPLRICLLIPGGTIYGTYFASSQKKR